MYNRVRSDESVVVSLNVGQQMGSVQMVATNHCSRKSSVVSSASIQVDFIRTKLGLNEILRRAKLG